MRQLERPTYQGSLRAIGRYLDRNVYRHVMIVETEDGFVLRVFADGANLKAEGIELPMSDLIALINAHAQSRGSDLPALQSPPLCPTGYEDFLRALGFELDALKVTGVRTIELSTGILVAFTARSAGGEIRRFETLYDRQRIEQSLEQSYQRRSKATPRPAL